jgi:hypothetical protein
MSTTEAAVDTAFKRSGKRAAGSLTVCACRVPCA